ncbi:hypothetical protein CAPTEDRAFT_224088 [Capitella teleta]|uniref:Calx-beta domain-containing protein n=1 Tax=Capitella teleta TaxID=283909 RepID=R7U4N1_CAPTE|nr:hypothetical protein CAPTEDRAFT_224088 [Capitella teleta]|eukprot:ELU01061.1 hypothetical protein CAPTEDRAFT_224088 [Capitella teleta]
MTVLHYANYSNGWVIEQTEGDDAPCQSWMLLPAENLWHVGIRGTLYIVAMLYMFIGIAIGSDAFMCSIEVITSKKRMVVRWDEERQERVEKEVLVWNETVANLTLMALGSSAPEILLAVAETLFTLGQEAQDGLGTFTIIGSAAFNLLLITAICVVAVPTGTMKHIKELGVFALTSAWSIFAYVWMLIVLSVFSPQEVEPWEAWTTLAFFPVMVLTAYAQDNGWWVYRCKRTSVDAMQSQVNVRVVGQRKNSTMHGMSRELGALEKERAMRQRVFINLEHPNSPHEKRFRHAAVRSMMGGRKTHVMSSTKANKLAQLEAARTKMVKVQTEEELIGKFTFGSPSYSVLESAGVLEIEVLFHRFMPQLQKGKVVANGSDTGNGKLTPIENETAFNERSEFGVVSVEYETREGSGKFDKDFKYTNGTLTFNENEYKKTISISIINDFQYEADTDFYVLLKNPGGGGTGDPSITRVTIIDDDEPGEFQFDEPHYYADPKSGTVTFTVLRQKGCDGSVTIEYSTIDGTARGGDKINKNTAFIRTSGTLVFKHNETSKSISVHVNKEMQGSKNFVMTLRNPSLGAKIGDNGAAMANLTTDDLAERIAEILDDDDEEEITWGGQIASAMTLECEKDDNGIDIPLKWYDYLMHFISFLWKVIFACLPPTKLWGAWPTFVTSLLAIGVLTVFVQQLGHLLGCVISLKPAVAGITIIALGTSLPDTFASRTAALHDEHADAAIGNVTGSNSVNVFLGLGLPWVMSSCYAVHHNQKFLVPTDNLILSVVIFTIVGTVCIIVLLMRRKVFGGELGGGALNKYLTATFLALLWVIYIVVASVKAYYPDSFAF